MYKIIKKLQCFVGINSHAMTVFNGEDGELFYLDEISDQELLDIFWNAYILGDKSKENLVTYMNKHRGHNLRVFRGENINGEYHAKEQWDGENWLPVERDIDARRDQRLKDNFKTGGNKNAE
jgi:hypothetical protein